MPKVSTTGDLDSTTGKDAIVNSLREYSKKCVTVF